MGRIVSFDIGKKRTGLAHTDPLQLIATALDTVNTDVLLAFLKKYLATEKVDAFVVGMPKTLRNEPSENAAFVNNMIMELESQFPTYPIYTIDERFTSKIAMDTMRESGISKKARQNKATTDKIAAVLLLQTYLNQKK